MSDIGSLSNFSKRHNNNKNRTRTRARTTFNRDARGENKKKHITLQTLLNQCAIRKLVTLNVITASIAV